ncbi:MAG: peptidylprolyl isomerase [Clostridia bacterium]|nr:peptidylprolyl isomerase [Clostridia bacterium]MBQ9856579.1 peptidylprolyl isomerase [Clostridia bacterium]
MQTRIAPVIVLTLVLALLGAAGNTVFMNTAADLTGTVPISEETNEIVNANPIATITVKGIDTPIIVELYPDCAPDTVANFVSLANSGFYDGLTFHRVIPTFMIQGGCPIGNGTGNPGYSIKGEFQQNGFENNLSHTRGVISMARAQAFDSAGSQFFIMHGDAAYLDGSYAAFGKVISGMETVDLIASVQTNYMDKPLTDQIIKEIRVDTKGIKYTVNKIGG